MRSILLAALVCLVSGPALAQSGTLFLSGGDIIGPNVVDIGAMLPPPDDGLTRLEITVDIGWQNEWCFETGTPGYYSADLNPVNGWSLDVGWPAGEIRLMNGRAVSPHLSVVTQTGARFDGTLDWQGPSSFCNAVSSQAATRSVTFSTNLLGVGPLLLRTRSGANGPVFLYTSGANLWNRARNTWGAAVGYRYIP